MAFDVNQENIHIFHTDTGKSFPVKDSTLQNFPQLNAFHGKPGFISLIGHRGARGLMPENTIEGSSTF